MDCLSLGSLEQNLDFELAQGDHIPIGEGMIHVWAEALAVYEGPIRGTQIHEEHVVCLPFQDSVQPRYPARICLIGRQIDIRHDWLALTDAAQGELIALGE